MVGRGDAGAQPQVEQAFTREAGQAVRKPAGRSAGGPGTDRRRAPRSGGAGCAPRRRERPLRRRRARSRPAAHRREPGRGRGCARTSGSGQRDDLARSRVPTPWGPRARHGRDRCTRLPIPAGPPGANRVERERQVVEEVVAPVLQLHFEPVPRDPAEAAPGGRPSPGRLLQQIEEPRPFRVAGGGGRPTNRSRRRT